VEIKIKEGDSEVIISTLQKLIPVGLESVLETTDYSEEFKVFNNRLDWLCKRIEAVEKIINEKSEKEETINPAVLMLQSIENVKQILNEGKIDKTLTEEKENFSKPQRPEKEKRLEEIKQRILNYAKEKDPEGKGFTFRYGADKNSASENSRREAKEIVQKVSGDKRKIYKALLALISEDRVTRKPHPEKKNCFLYFTNNGKFAVKDVFDEKKAEEVRHLVLQSDFTTEEEYLKN